MCIRDSFDGRPGIGFARWPSIDEFVKFFAVQSNRSMDRSPGAAAGFETKDTWSHGNQTLTRKRLEAFVAQVEDGKGLPSSDYIEEGPSAVLVLEEVLDRTALLRFLRDDLGYQLKEANEMLKNLPARLYGIYNTEAGEEWIRRFADAGGRCAVHSE